MKTTHALAAQAIRKELAQAFPGIKFSVVSESYAGGNSVRISYCNGVPSDLVRKTVDRYQYGHFDGMEDIYEYSNVADEIPQVKYVSVNRHISDEIREKTKIQLALDYGIEELNDEQKWYEKTSRWSDQVIYQELVNKTL